MQIIKPGRSFERLIDTFEEHVSCKECRAEFKVNGSDLHVGDFLSTLYVSCPCCNNACAWYTKPDKYSRTEWYQLQEDISVRQGKEEADLRLSNPVVNKKPWYQFWS